MIEEFYKTLTRFNEILWSITESNFRLYLGRLTQLYTELSWIEETYQEEFGVKNLEPEMIEATYNLLKIAQELNYKHLVLLVQLKLKYVYGIVEGKEPAKPDESIEAIHEAIF